MRNTYEVRAEKFIHEIFNYIWECEEVEDYEWAVIRFNHEHHRHVRVANGLTRVALITSDYVVKIDCGSRYHIDTFGGCANEFDIYAQAEADGFEYLFAKPTAVEYNGLSFCVMPRIRGIGRKEYDADWYMKPNESDWVCERVFDMHNGNYGWKDGHPVLIDYAANR